MNEIAPSAPWLTVRRALLAVLAIAAAVAGGYSALQFNRALEPGSSAAGRRAATVASDAQPDPRSSTARPPESRSSRRVPDAASDPVIGPAARDRAVEPPSSSAPSAEPPLEGVIASPSASQSSREKIGRPPARAAAAPRIAPKTSSEPTAPPQESPRSAALIARGTLLVVRPAELVASNHSRPGDQFRGYLAEKLPYRGGAVPAGSVVVGRVVEARPSGRVRGRAYLSMELRELEIRGERHAVETEEVVLEAQASTKRDAKTVAIGTAVGGALGGLLGGKKGAAKGVAVGAAGGTAGVLATKGLEVEVSEESVLYFTLREDFLLQAGPSSAPSQP